MWKEKLDQTLDIDLACIESRGITYDFFNEVPFDPDNELEINWFINRCKRGEAKTYTQRFQDSPKILEKSDHEKVEKIDHLMLKAIDAAVRGDMETTKQKIRGILLFRR